MHKFNLLENEELTFEQNINEVDRNLYPFKMILNDENIDDLLFDDVLVKSTLRLSLSPEGKDRFIFVIDKEGFNRYDFMEKISILKSEECPDKVTSLFDIMKEYKIHFIIIKKDKESTIDINTLTSEYVYFVIAYDEALDNIVPVVNQEVKQDEDHSSHNPISELKSNKYHFLLVIVSSLLIEISLPLGMLNYYSNNMLYLFLYICVGIGGVMIGFAYYDYFKNKNIINISTLFSLIAHFIGLGLGTLSFMLFYDISTISEGTPSMMKLITNSLLISLAIIFGIIILFAIICNVIKKKSK